VGRLAQIASVEVSPLTGSAEPGSALSLASAGMGEKEKSKVAEPKSG
jgi:hypothetical protein